MCHKILLFAMAIAMLAACQGAPLDQPTPAPTSIPTTIPMPTSTPIPIATPLPTPTIIPTATPFPEEFYGETQVGDYKLHIECKGKGEPTIILENGLDYSSWPFASRFSKISRTCIYPRAGMAGEPAKGPRTTLDQVKDLHALLAQTGVPGPYILVGHSIAGYNLLLYTDQYPQEVVGLVCIDCSTPYFPSIYLEKLKVEFAGDPDAAGKISALLKKYGLAELDTTAIMQSSEKLDVNASILQVIHVTSLENRPLVVLVAGQHVISPSLYEKSYSLLGESWIESSKKLSQLSTQGRMEIVSGTTHISILGKDAVNLAVQEVYDKVKKE